MQTLISPQKRWLRRVLTPISCEVRIPIAFVITDFLASLIAFVFRFIWMYRRETIRRNLRDAFTKNTDGERAVIERDYYHHLSTLLASPVILQSMRRENLHRVVRYEQLEKLRSTFNEGRNAVLMASHVGNWEYLLSLPLFTEYQVVAVCARIKNPFVQQKMLGLRTRYGARLVFKDDFYRYVLSNKSMTPTLYVIIADQRPSGGSKQSVEFFDRETRVPTGADRIARHLECPVFYADVWAGARHQYIFRFELLTQNAALEKPWMVMEEYYSLLENTIRRKPELWLWSHRRWKVS